MFAIRMEINMQIKNKYIIIVCSSIINGVVMYLMFLFIYKISSHICYRLISTELCNENPLMPIIQWMCVAGLMIGLIGGGILGYIATNTKGTKFDIYI